MLRLCRKPDIRTEETHIHLSGIQSGIQLRGRRQPKSQTQNEDREARTSCFVIWLTSVGSDFVLEQMAFTFLWSNSSKLIASQASEVFFKATGDPVLGCVNFRLVIFKSQDKMLWFCCNRLPDTWADCGALQRTFGVTKLWLANGSCSIFTCHLCSRFLLH